VSNGGQDSLLSLLIFEQKTERAGQRDFGFLEKLKNQAVIWLLSCPTKQKLRKSCTIRYQKEK